MQILAKYNNLSIILDRGDFDENGFDFWVAVKDGDNDGREWLSFPPTETGLVEAVQFLLARVTQLFFAHGKHLTLASRLLATEEKARVARDEILRGLLPLLPKDGAALHLWLKKAKAAERRRG
jgi:hypothetical protein